MNREDLERAIKYGTEWLKDEYLDARDGAFIEIALEALKQMPVITTTGEGGVIYYPQVEGVTPTVVDAGKQEPSGDAVDRKLVCAFIDGLISDDGERKKGLEYIRNMPPVNPTKTGHWEQYGNSWEDKFKCSECGKEQPKILCGERIIGHWSDYCPNCGCRMDEPQERSSEG